MRYKCFPIEGGQGKITRLLEVNWFFFFWSLNKQATCNIELCQVNSMVSGKTVRSDNRYQTLVKWGYWGQIIIQEKQTTKTQNQSNKIHAIFLLIRVIQEATMHVKDNSPSLPLEKNRELITVSMKNIFTHKKILTMI